MRLWIDCEFNSYKGQLMSLALVGEGDAQFYVVLPLPDEIDPWVQTNVVPILGANPMPYRDAQNELETFLAAFDSVHIVADWPEDIAHFCDFLITGPGQRIDTPPLTMEVVRVDAPSKVPHNALWDAIGIRDFMLADAALSHAAGQDGEQCRAASGWRPVDSAPLREAVIVYHRARWDRLACLHEDGVWWPWPRQAGDEHLSYSPTHWHPIPEAPNE